MITKKKIEQIKIKMVKNNINQSKLARLLHCSNTSLSNVLTNTKELKYIEKRLMQWLYDETITYIPTRKGSEN